MNKTKGCLYIIIFLVAADIGLALIYPQLAEWYGQLNDRRVCSNLPEDTQVYVQDPLPEIAVDDVSLEPITGDNVAQLVYITDIEPVEHFRQYNLGYNILEHSSGDYGIYLYNPPSTSATITFCDNEGKSLKTLIRDETAMIKFSPDNTLLSVYETRFGTIELYDSNTLEPVITIDVHGDKTYTSIRSIAFHPTEPILAFTRNISGSEIHELYLWDIENNVLIDSVEISETYENSLTFNTEGMLLYYSNDDGGHVWGIPTGV
jgi:WD40 repeat protein